MIRWIHRHSEYQEFISADLVIRTKFFTIIPLQTGIPEFAYGLTISRKIGKAVIRNLLRRRIKAWFRQTALPLPIGIKVILIAKPDAGKLAWQQLDAGLSDVITRIRQETRAFTKPPATT